MFIKLVNNMAKILEKFINFDITFINDIFNLQISEWKNTMDIIFECLKKNYYISAKYYDFINSICENDNVSDIDKFKFSYILDIMAREYIHKNYFIKILCKLKKIDETEIDFLIHLFDNDIYLFEKDIYDIIMEKTIYQLFVKLIKCLYVKYCKCGLGLSEFEDVYSYIKILHNKQIINEDNIDIIKMDEATENCYKRWKLLIDISINIDIYGT